MKKILLALVPAIFLAFTFSVSLAQQNNETEIRKLENMEAQAILLPVMLFLKNAMFLSVLK